MSDNPQVSTQIDQYVIELMKESLPDTIFIIKNIENNEVIYDNSQG